MRFAAALVLLLATPTAYAQSTTGAIQGVVTDQSGAPLGSAAIIVTNTATGLERALVTDAGGRFAAPGLPPGPYEVTAALAGHATRRQEGLRVHARETISLRLELSIAAAADTLTVGGMPPAIEPTRSHATSLVTAPAIDDLPLDRRSLADLALLTPGVTGTVPTGTISVGGLPGALNSLVLDGADAGDGLMGTPGFEAVQEVRVNTAGYPAAHGRAAGAVVDVITKSGTNTFGGSAFEFFGDDALNANTRINEVSRRPKDPYRSHQFGGLLSGPIVEDEHFFLLNYEGWRGDLDANLFLARTDHQLSDPLRLAVRYHQQGDSRRGVIGSAATVLRPSVVNEARVAWSDDFRNRAQIADTVTLVRGAHAIEAGVDLLFEEGAADDHAVFVHDQWQPGAAVTVNAGLRVGDDVAPRLGAAWSPGRRRVIVRGAYGLFHEQEARAQHATAGVEWEWVPNTTVSASYLSIRGDDLPGTTRYNGLLAELHRRFWQGAYYRVAYTLGKATDDAGAPVAGDRRHRLNASAVYTTDLFAERVGGVMEELLKDFTLGVIWAIQSGPPGTLAAADERTRLRRVTVDTRVARRIDLGDRRELQLIWQAFNLRNRANYLAVTPPVPAEPRTMQLAVKFLF